MNELTINLDTESNIPLYEQIYSYIKMEIQRKKIPVEEKLPSTRALSKHLEVSRSTVDLAYEQLLSEGYIEAVPYVGYFVSQVEGLYKLEAKEIEKPEKPDRKKKVYTVDFSPDDIHLESFPYNTWRKLSKEILNDEKGEIFQLGDSKGESGLREAVAFYLRQARGVDCDPSQIVVGSGNDYLLILLEMILGRNHIVGMENPSYKQAFRIFKSKGYKVKALEADKDGLTAEELDRKGADIAYVMPSHQFPLGIVMPIKRRIEILKWAEERDNRYIIEDDHDSEFRYKGKPIPALQGYDRNEKVIYLGTFSKSIAPGIRISYMVLPVPLLEKYEKQYSYLSNTVPRIDQMILTKFMKEGYFGRHLNKMRGIYKSKHDLMLNELKNIPGCTIEGEYAGLHFLVRFQNGMQEKELVSRARKAGIKVYGLSEYYIKPVNKGESTILLGYGNLSDDEIKTGIEKLKKALL